MTELLVIFTPADLIGLSHEDLRRRAVLTLDAESCMQLRSSGIDALSPDYADLEQQAQVAHSFWRENAAISHRGANLLALVGYRHSRWITRLCAVACAVNAAIDRIAPQTLIVRTPPGGHALDRPADAHHAGALAAVALGVASTRGLMTVVDAPPPLPLHNPPRPHPSPRHQPTTEDFETSPGHLLCILDGSEHSRAQPWIERLRPTLSEGVVVATHGEQREGSIGVDDYAGPRQRRTEPLDEAALNHLLNSAKRLSHAIRPIFCSQGLTEHFAFIFRDYAASVASNLDRWLMALRARKPGAVVAAYPSIATEAAAITGTPTLILPHGPMMTATKSFYSTLPKSTRIGAVNKVHASALTAQGINRNRIHITGSPIPAHDTATHAPRTTEPPTALFPTLDVAIPTHLGEPPAVSLEDEIAAMRSVAFALSQRGWRIRLRPHPRYDRSREFYRRALADIPDKLFILGSQSTTTLAQDVQGSTAVVFCATPTSAIPECAALGRPVVLTGGAASPAVLGSYGIADFHAEPTIKGAIEHLERIRSDEIFARQQTERSMHAARAFSGADSADRTHNAIHTMLGAHTCQVTAAHGRSAQSGS